MAEAVISDTSCLIAITNIGRLELLRKLFGNVIVTPTVRQEFGDGLPDWFQVIAPDSTEILLELEARLDAGEASAIALALQLEGATLIIDELKGRRAAILLGINIIGTIGVLARAKNQGLLESPATVLDELQRAGFRISDELRRVFGEG
jgi:predicted nucleic acid-binding protein